VSASAVGWDVAVGDQITASIIDPAGGLPAGLKLGARVETPYTRAIVSAYQRGTLANGQWTVTVDGVLEAGGYLFVWRTDDAEPPYYEVFLPIEIVPEGATSADGSGVYPPVDAEAIRPSTDDVATLERTRIVDPGGGDPGTFTADTHPTAAEVEKLIDAAIDDVMVLIPYAIDPRHYEQVRNAVTLYSAVLVESSYFREQMEEGSVALYREMYEATIASINARATEDDRSAAIAVHEGTILA
jgi:hypothetical protein